MLINMKRQEYVKYCDGFFVPQRIGISLESITDDFWKSVNYDPEICKKCLRLKENGNDIEIGRLCPIMSLFYFVYGFILEKKAIPSDKELEAILRKYI